MSPTSLDTHLQAIRAIFPHEIFDVTSHDNGDDFFVLEINYAWIFRFPRTDVSHKALATERAFLARFRPLAPLPVPDYRYETTELVGYPKIHGLALSPGLFNGLSLGTRARLARQIGQFFSAVHGFPVDEAKALGVTEGWDGWYVKIIRHFQDEIALRLTPIAREKTLACVRQVLAEPFAPRVIHGDFSLEDHVFFDEERQEIGGVIDFADVTINDPAHDFQNILEYGGEDFFQAVLAHYTCAPNPGLLQRTRLRVMARPLFEASYSHLFGFEARYRERLAWIEAQYGHS